MESSAFLLPTGACMWPRRTGSSKMGELITIASITSAGWVLLQVGGPALAEKLRTSVRARRDER